VERNSQRISVESREGTLLGEVSTLSGGLRTADLVAVEDTWVAILNSSELEELITRHPSVGLRMLKTLAARLQQAITTP
jgi:CRP-like cAMP-binding protein